MITTSRDELLDYLRMMREFDDVNCRKYSTTDSWLADKGAFFEGERLKLPDKQVRARSNQCYLNAWRYIQRRQRSNAALRRGLRYCEGLAVLEGCPLPVWHGWVVDGEGHIIDPSIEHERVTIYFGVMFDPAMAAKLWEQILKQNCIGIVGNLWVMGWHVRELEPYIFAPTAKEPA
jgi:hypothetical protein